MKERMIGTIALLLIGAIGAAADLAATLSSLFSAKPSPRVNTPAGRRSS